MSQFNRLEDQYGLPPGLLNAVMQVESGGNINAVSPRGARGPFQFMPATAKQYGVNTSNLASSADGAARMYAALLKQSGGDLPKALAGYNWGQGNVARKGMDNMPDETRGYITKVTANMQPQANNDRDELTALRRMAELEAKAAGQQESAPQQPATAAAQAPMSRLSKIGKGAIDPIEGGAQLLTNILPEGVVDAGNKFNNWLAEKTGLVGKLPQGGMNELVKQNEQAYQSKRAAAGESGFDGYRTIGNVVSPANLAIASKLPMAASLAGRMGVGAAGGGTVAALNPVTADGSYWGQKGAQAALGTAFGAATPLATGAVSRMISPRASIDPRLAMLKASGVKPTVGQTLGGWVNAVEEKAQSLPIMGDMITSARRHGTETLNRAAYNRALSPIGLKLPTKATLGGESVEYVGSKLGDAYEALLPKLTTQADDVFISKIDSLKAMVSEGALDPKYTALFEKTLKTRVLDKFQGQKSMSGQTLKDTESFLTNEIKRFGVSQDPDARLMGDALKEVQSQLRELVSRTNPKHALELKAINTGYANFKRVQNAAGRIGADDGVFTPAQLQSAVRAMDRSKDKARFAEGNALMQDLSGAGKSMMGGKIADSGTAGRLMLGGGALGSYLINPAIPAGLLGGAGLYTSPMQTMLRGMVSTRPQTAQAIADALRKGSPTLIPGGAQVGLGLMNQIDPNRY